MPPKRASSRASSGARKPPTFESKVQKKIADNFKGFDSNETDVKVVDGLTLRQVITRDLKQHEQSLPPFVMGKLYYAGLHAKYNTKESMAGLLQVRDPEQAVDPMLVRAMCAANKAATDYSGFMGYLQTATLPNQKELVGILRQAVLLKPGCKKKLPLALNVLRYVERVGIKEGFHAEFEIVKPWILSVLEAALRRSRAGGTDDQVFMRTHKRLLKLLLPEGALDDVHMLKDTDDIGPHSGSFNALVSASPLGAKLFGWAINYIKSHEVGDLIRERVNDLFGQKQNLTEEECAAHEKETQRLVEAIPCVDHLPAYRKVTVMYKLRRLSVNVGSTLEQVQLTYAAARKAIAVVKGEIPLLWIESLLFPAGTGSGFAATAPCPEGATAAREKLASLVGDCNAETGDLVQHTLDTHRSLLQQSDPTFKIEEAIVSELTGADGEQIILDNVVRCLPSKEVGMLAEQSAQKIHALVSSTLFSIAHKSVQEKVKVIQGHINSIASVQTPSIEDALQSPSLGRIVTTYQFFLQATTVTVPKAGGGKLDADKGKGKGLPQVVRGVAAIPYLLQKVAADVAKGAAVQRDVEQFKVFTWLLTPAQKEEAKLLADKSKAGHAAAVEQEGSKPKKARKAGKTEADKAMEASMKMFD